MPRLNKCKHREKHQGFIRQYLKRGQYHTQVSSNPWFGCALIKGDGSESLNKLKCKGRKCGKYEEEKV